MTRLGVLADIHGNLPALQAVIEDMAAFKVNHVVVAGDSINWGPFSAQVLETVFARNWAVVRGNNAFYLLDYDTSRSPKQWRDYSIPAVLHEQLGENWTQVIAHRRVPFDYDSLFAEFERQRFEERCGVQGRLVVEEFRAARLRLHPFIHWMQIRHPHQPQTHALLDAFLEIDIDSYMPGPYRHL